jgi:hypothetical protein
VLGPALTRREALALENSAKRHWRAGVRAAMLLAVELRQLQDGGAHLVRGFSNFGEYAENRFDGLSAANAKQLSRQGGVLLALYEAKRINLRDQCTYPGTTGLRELSAVRGKLGDVAMLKVWDAARKLRPGFAVVDRDVRAALRALFPPAPVTVPPAPTFDDEQEDGDELPEALRPLADRTVTVIDLARDLLGAIEDGDAGQIRRAQRALLEGVALVDDAMP